MLYQCKCYTSIGAHNNIHYNTVINVVVHNILILKFINWHQGGSEMVGEIVVMHKTSNSWANRRSNAVRHGLAVHELTHLTYQRFSVIFIYLYLSENDNDNVNDNDNKKD